MQVSLSIQSPVVTAPFPALIELHFHNSGNQVIWLYRPLADAASMSGSAGGAAVEVHLETSPSRGSSAIPGVGALLRVAGFPHPDLFALQPGGDTTESAMIHVEPATQTSGAADAPVWGGYRMSLIYRAAYANLQSIARATGVKVWTGSVPTNAVEITLRPPSATSQGSVSGTVTDRQGRLDPGVLVSLADDQQRLVMQAVTDSVGSFQFGELPFGRYWVTVRWPGVDHDTSFFEHADLDASQPAAAMKLIMLEQETYEGKQMLHKPVLIRVTRSDGSPVAGATLKILWSNGSVTESERASANETGLAVVNMIPGTNYVTVIKHGCAKLDQMADVAPGSGIDGDGITDDCKR
ncbi:MAG: carboxypeptidase regulatory-like domain-containing protein [Terriglobia bacterium]